MKQCRQKHRRINGAIKEEAVILFVAIGNVKESRSFTRRNGLGYGKTVSSITISMSRHSQSMTVVQFFMFTNESKTWE
uniref:Uncharacterized protein n=1 Tax=Onchocerca volvulus TaxID=6282 RepID=A0A8R1Y3X3_ONCVO